MAANRIVSSKEKCYFMNLFTKPHIKLPQDYSKI